MSATRTAFPSLSNLLSVRSLLMYSSPAITPMPISQAATARDVNGVSTHGQSVDALAGYANRSAAWVSARLRAMML